MRETKESRWQIELLGGLRITRGDRAITRFRRQKAADLLAYLAYFPRHPHSREALIEIVGCAPRFLRCARGPHVAFTIAARKPPRPFRLIRRYQATGS